MEEASLKSRTARSVKWNIIDRVSSQVLYAVTGIILARQLSQEAFGLVGAILVFQSFALLFIDSGFSFALIQRKQNTDLGYSSVLWFNMLIATVIYAVLWFAMPAIAGLFGGNPMLVPLGRVMFLSFIINASAIVQTNRLAKQMNFKPIAVTNTLGLAVGAVVGIWLAYAGYGPWAIVWQTIAINAVKSLSLWVYCRWLPMLRVSLSELRAYFSVGSGMMMTSFLNVVFQNIYSFFVGNRSGLVSLGYYTQSDKWSKMGVTAVSQVLTSSFLPSLSEVQDDAERFRRLVSKMNRFTAYLLFPAILFLIAGATPLFHTLFGEKWDPSIVLFQLLLVRGIFTVLNSLYNNYMLALGRTRAIFWLEVVRDGVAVALLVAAFPFLTMTTADNPVYGLQIMLYGQVAASAVTWIATIVVAVRITGMRVRGYLWDLTPYFVSSGAIALLIYALNSLALPAWQILAAQVVIGLALYFVVNRIFPSKIQKEIFVMLNRKTFNRNAQK